MSVLVLGASGHAKVLLDALALQGAEVAGLLDDGRPVGTRLGGHAVLGPIADVASLAAHTGADAFVVAIGDGTTRERVTRLVCTHAPSLAAFTVVHPSAVIGRGASLGPGAAVLAGAVVGVDCIVEEGAIINTRASIDHDGHLGAFASLGPGATLGGGVRVGRQSFVALGASVLHGRAIGAESVLGAGAVLTRDLPERVVALGIPARVVRARAPGDRYL